MAIRTNWARRKGERAGVELTVEGPDPWLVPVRRAGRLGLPPLNPGCRLLASGYRPPRCKGLDKRAGPVRIGQQVPAHRPEHEEIRAA